MMMNQHTDATNPAPPIDAGPLDTDETVSSWPTTIGVVSLIYALGGLLCAVGIAGSTFFMESLMKLGGMDVTTPPLIKINGVISAILMVIAGCIMLTGAVKLM